MGTDAVSRSVQLIIGIVNGFGVDAIDDLGDVADRIVLHLAVDEIGRGLGELDPLEGGEGRAAGIVDLPVLEGLSGSRGTAAQRVPIRQADVLVDDVGPSRDRRWKIANPVQQQVGLVGVGQGLAVGIGHLAGPIQRIVGVRAGIGPAVDNAGRRGRPAVPIIGPG